MQMDVYNWHLDVCNIQVTAVSTSSVFLVGDNEMFQMSSFFNTPPESYPLENVVPLAPIGISGVAPGVTGAVGTGVGAGAGAGAGAGIHGGR